MDLWIGLVSPAVVMLTSVMGTQGPGPVLVLTIRSPSEATVVEGLAASVAGDACAFGERISLPLIHWRMY